MASNFPSSFLILSAVILIVISLIAYKFIQKKSPMFAKYLLGYIGIFVVIIGIILIVTGIFGSGAAIIFGIVFTIGGGYMRYLSSQAVSVEHSEQTLNVNQNINFQNTDQNKVFSGEKDLTNDTYQLYLVEKYQIKKNDTLNKYVLNDKPYSELKDALEAAHNLE
tara:strand:- start:161 stop:655 length:495 start_codon:yes stop_codon:yes gene_type:complete